MRALALAAMLGWAAVPQVPARDATPPPSASGNAAIAGVVTADDEAHTPLRHVTLSLARAGQNQHLVTGTDDRGRFLFDRLAPGTYLLSATKGAYVPANYGATSVGGPGSPIPIAAAQTFTAHPIVLMRGGVITGRVTDATGAPALGVEVDAMQFHTTNGVRHVGVFPGSTGSARTDSRGVYRIFGLAPGTYVVVVAARTADGGAPFRETTQADADWADEQLRQMAPAAASTSAASPLAKSFVAAPTYYPGTADAGAAAGVSLGRGEERPSVDVQLQTLHAGRVHGKVVGPDGAGVASAFLTVYSPVPDVIGAGLAFRSSATTTAEGEFTLAAVAPGVYSISARTTATRDAGGAVDPMSALSGSTELTVAGDDVDGVVVRVQRGSIVSGRIVFAGAAGTAAPDPRALQVRLVQAVAPSVVTLMGTPTASAGQDVAFAIKPVPPGDYRIEVTSTGAIGAWHLRAATAGGKDVLDAPLHVAPGTDVTDLVATFSDRQTSLHGKLVDASGNPAAQLYVLAFAADQAHWTAASRWIKAARAGVDGSYLLDGLPPGDYYVCALTELDQTQQFDPAYLGQFVSGSIKIAIADGEQRALDLKIGS